MYTRATTRKHKRRKFYLFFSRNTNNFVFFRGQIQGEKDAKNELVIVLRYVKWCRSGIRRNPTLLSLPRDAYEWFNANCFIENEICGRKVRDDNLWNVVRVTAVFVETLWLIILSWICEWKPQQFHFSSAFFAFIFYIKNQIRQRNYIIFAEQHGVCGCVCGVDKQSNDDACNKRPLGSCSSLPNTDASIPLPHPHTECVCVLNIYFLLFLLRLHQIHLITMRSACIIIIIIRAISRWSCECVSWRSVQTICTF